MNPKEINQFRYTPTRVTFSTNLIVIVSLDSKRKRYKKVQVFIVARPYSLNKPTKNIVYAYTIHSIQYVLHKILNVLY